MTIAQQLNITEFPFSIKNAAGKEIYWEDVNGFWEKWEYGANGKSTRYETSTGCWVKKEYTADGNLARREDSNGYWETWEYDTNGEQVYYETKYGIELDNRPKTELTLDEIAAEFGIPVGQLKIKK